MQYVGYRITFLRAFMLVYTLCLAAVCLVLLTPRDTAALSLSQTLGQLAKATKALQVNAHKQPHVSSEKKQPEQTSTTPTRAQTASQPLQPTATPQVPPSQEALPPPIEPISTVPPRGQLLAFAPKSLKTLALLETRPIGAYPHVDSFAVVRPSAEGWKILGISWLWWTAGSVLVWLGVRWHKAYVQ